MRPLPVNAQVRGPVIAPQTHGGVPQLPTREEYFAAKNRAAAVAAEQGTAPAVLANGGSMIADAYSTEEEAEAEQQQLVGA